MPDFTIRVDGDDLVFGASHFITFEGGQCEALHGHDFHVAVELCGTLNASQYVVDLVLLHDIVKGILAELDHRALVPQNHPRIQLRASGDELEVTLGRRRWVLPKDDCVLLPAANTTDENLAQLLAVRVCGRLSERGISPPRSVKVEVREGGGFTAIYEHRADG